MICKYPPESRMHNACILCNERDLCGGINTMLYDDNPSYTIPMPKVEPPKGKLLSAEESRKRADEAVDNALIKELQEIATKINAASKEGNYSCSDDGCLKPKTREKLEELGYKVEVGNQYNQSWYSISWK